MADSLSSTIKQAILTDAPSDVTIQERSLVSAMIAHQRKGEPLSFKMVFEGNPLKCQRFPIAHTLLYVLRCLIMGLILLIYAAYEVVYRLFTGKKRNMRPSVAINTVILSGTIVIAILALVFSVTFLVRNVLLSPNEASINSNGVVSINQPCMETQYFYLLNAATYWTSSGIAVSRGDRVYISASGGMYSDIGEMCDKASDNSRLLYPRSSFAVKKKWDKEDTTGIQYCIYDNPDDARFGSLLCLIANETQNPEYHFKKNSHGKIRQLDYKTNDIRFTAGEKDRGILYFTFNDILLDSDTYNKISANKDNDKDSAAINMWKDLADSGKDKYESIKDPTIWFKDNLGEALVNIRIEKSIRYSSLRCHEKIAMHFYRGISRLKTDFWHSWIPRDAIVLLFLLLADIWITHLRNRKREQA